MQHLITKTRLREPIEGVHTFPSWRPQHNIDHILVTSELTIEKFRELEHFGSDHLPLMTEVRLPVKMRLERYHRTRPLSFDDYLHNLDS